MTKQSQHYLSAIFLMFYGAVGSGIFVLPYVFYHSNLIFSLFFYIFIVLITIVLNYFYSEIVLSTPGNHQLAGYARIYLGRCFKYLAALNLILLISGSLLAYFKLFYSFLPLFVPLPEYITQTVFILIISLSFYFRSRFPAFLHFLIPLFLLLFPIFLFLFSLFFTNHYSLITNYYPTFAFFPPALFALSGFTIIPEVRELHPRLAKTVLIGTFLTAVTYLFFVLGIIRLSAPQVSVDSLTGLLTLHPLLARFSALFGIFAILQLGSQLLQVLHELLFRDLKFSPFFSRIVPFFFPIIISMFTNISLLSVISLTGHVIISLSALIICLIRLQLPHGFWTRFFVILIFVVLLLTFLF